MNIQSEPIEYGMGRVDYERMGGALELGSGDEKDRLTSQIWAIAMSLDGMDQKRVINIIELTENLPRREAKNPAAIVVAYLCLKDGEIDQARFKKVVGKILPVISSQYNLTAPDVLRYARLLKNQLEK